MGEATLTKALLTRARADPEQKSVPLVTAHFYMSTLVVQEQEKADQRLDELGLFEGESRFERLQG